MFHSFKLNISRDRLSAYLYLVKKVDESLSITISQLEEFVRGEKVTSGILYDNLKKLAQNPNNIEYPVMIAQGIPPVNGSDAYISIEDPKENTLTKEKINYRNVMRIPSVRNGQTIATVIPETNGVNGADVLGRVILAKNGKKLTIKPGKNVIFTGDQFVATIDGQVSITSKIISVNPVYEVKGDLDLKTGNIQFIGNVVIHGNVPNGYEIHAGGDIKIFGLVEGAHLQANGNILISGGIAGGNKGTVTAVGNIHAAYLNQANVKTEQDLFVDGYIMHSKVEASGSIHCQKGQVIGGFLISGKDIHVKEIGNHLYTKTDCYIGVSGDLEISSRELTHQLEGFSDNLRKINEIETKLIEIARLRGNFTDEQKTLLVKQRTTKAHLNSKIEELSLQLNELEEERREKLKATIHIYEMVFPNTTFHFGKYSRVIQQKHACVKFKLKNNEIVSEPI